MIDDGLIVIHDRDFREAKSIGGRWDERRKAWTLPASLMSAYALRDTDPETDLRASLGPPSVPFSDDRLYQYQQDAVGRLMAARHGQLLVLSPGLGKTAVAVVAADQMVPDDKIVVVAPASLLLTWEREIRKWATVPPDPIYVMRGKIDWDAAASARWIIVSWDKVARDPGMWGRGWPLWVLDESVLTKSRGSRRFAALKDLRRGVKNFWLLSGSPVTRYVDDLWAQLYLLWPSAFSSYWRFAERYAIVEETPWARKVVGTRRGRDAMEENGDLIMVVNQEDVLDLPEYLFETIDVELGQAQARAYRDMEHDFITELGDGTEVIAQNEVAKLGKLQQITSYWDGNSAKQDTLAEIMDGYDEPHLIWTHWREGAAALAARIGAAHVSGNTPHHVRDKTIEDFKAGRLYALVLSIGVGKFGHTLTSAKTVWYVDKTWNADDYFQSLRRVRRIGLEHRPVVVTLRAPGTVDELVEENLEGKLGGISRLTRSNLRELLLGLGKKI